MKKHKNLFLIAASILLTVLTAEAQSADPAAAPKKGALEIGITVIPQMSALRNMSDESSHFFSYENTFSYAGGISAQYLFTEKAGIGLDLLYSMQGQKYSYQWVEYYKQLDYIKIPLMFVYKEPIGSKHYFVAKVGPQIGLLSSAVLADQSGHTIGTNTKSEYQGMDYSMLVSFGLSFKASEKLAFDLGIKYDYSFSNAENTGNNAEINTNAASTGTAINRPGTYNSTFGLYLGVKYCLK